MGEKGHMPFLFESHDAVTWNAQVAQWDPLLQPIPTPYAAYSITRAT